MSASFVNLEQDDFNPQYGEVNWNRRLNVALEAGNVILQPVGYKEDKGTMQVTQENTVIYINQIADELDCIAVNYEPDGADMYTWYWREMFEGDDMFAHVVSVVGAWATQIVTMYPLPHVVKQFENFCDAQIPNEVPDGLEDPED